MSKKTYQAPDAEIVLFRTTDVIFESDNATPWSGNPEF